MNASFGRPQGKRKLPKLVHLFNFPPPPPQETTNPTRPRCWLFFCLRFLSCCMLVVENERDATELQRLRRRGRTQPGHEVHQIHPPRTQRKRQRLLQPRQPKLHVRYRDDVERDPSRWKRWRHEGQVGVDGREKAEALVVHLGRGARGRNR